MSRACHHQHCQYHHHNDYHLQPGQHHDYQIAEALDYQIRSILCNIQFKVKEWDSSRCPAIKYFCHHCHLFVTLHQVFLTLFVLFVIIFITGLFE